MFKYLAFHFGDLRFKSHRSHLISLGEYDGKRNLALSELEKEVHVYLSDVVAGVDQDKEHDHLVREVEIVSDDLFQLLLSCSGHLCIAVSWKVYKIPLPVDEEVVDQPGLSGLAGSHGKILLAAEHVDQRRLADIGSSDEGEFREFLLRLLGDSRAASGKKCFGDPHFMPFL